MIDGHPDQLKFVAYYFRSSYFRRIRSQTCVDDQPFAEGQNVVAAASMQRDPIVAHISELMKIDKMLTKDELKAGKVSRPRQRLSRLELVPECTRGLNPWRACHRTRSSSPSSAPSRMMRRRPHSRRHPRPRRASDALAMPCPVA